MRAFIVLMNLKSFTCLLLSIDILSATQPNDGDDQKESSVREQLKLSIDTEATQFPSNISSGLGQVNYPKDDSRNRLRTDFSGIQLKYDDSCTNEANQTYTHPQHNNRYIKDSYRKNLNPGVEMQYNNTSALSVNTNFMTSPARQYQQTNEGFSPNKSINDPQLVPPVNMNFMTSQARQYQQTNEGFSPNKSINDPQIVPPVNTNFMSSPGRQYQQTNEGFCPNRSINSAREIIEINLRSAMPPVRQYQQPHGEVYPDKSTNPTQAAYPTSSNSRFPLVIIINDAYQSNTTVKRHIKKEEPPRYSPRDSSLPPPYYPPLKKACANAPPDYKPDISASVRNMANPELVNNDNVPLCLRRPLVYDGGRISPGASVDERTMRKVSSERTDVSTSTSNYNTPKTAILSNILLNSPLVPNACNPSNNNKIVSEKLDASKLENEHSTNMVVEKSNDKSFEHDDIEDDDDKPIALRKLLMKKMRKGVIKRIN